MAETSNPTFTEWMRAQLDDCALFPEQIDAILEKVKADPANKAMETRWEDRINGYEKSYLAVARFTMITNAIEWLEANKPRHWVLPALRAQITSHAKEDKTQEAACQGRTRPLPVKQLQDLDKMPFGKHRGVPMQDVPTSYLHWLWQNGLKNEVKTNPVAEYISRNLHALKKENSDLIWS